MIKQSPQMKFVKHSLPCVLFLVLLFVACSNGTPISSASSKTAQNQMELNKQACDEYKKVDAEMNRVYQTVLRNYATDRAFIASLRKAQLAWISYRDAHVGSIYPGDASQYGSINQMCRCQQLADITEERTKRLKQWVDGVEEGDVCAGSVKVK